MRSTSLTNGYLDETGGRNNMNTSLVIRSVGNYNFLASAI
jgi:hypothetical protein